MSLPPGTAFGTIRLERLLGRGGMGEVYLATDTALDRLVAVKVLPAELAENEGFRRRFLAESRLAASLDHPNLVPVHEAGERDGRLVIVMRYVDGEDLGARLARDGAISPPTAVHLLRGIADALDAAHEKGLVHRDVKPSNILLSRAGAGGEHAYLADFGLVKELGGSVEASVAGDLVGTVGYIAPEQIEGRPVDGRADIYSLACVLYECLTGRPPFLGERDVATLWAHLQAERPRPSALRPELAPFDDVIARGMALEPADRYGSASELMAEAAVAMTAPAPTPSSTDSTGSTGSTASPVTRVRDVRKIVTILVASVIGFTAAGHPLDPEALRPLRNRWSAIIRRIVEAHGGTIEPGMGGAMIAVFGVPVVHEDDALRAVRAALEIRDALAALDQQLRDEQGVSLRFHGGVATGGVVAGDPDADNGLVTGDTANAATLLGQGAAPGEVWLGRLTYTLVRDAVQAEPVDRAATEAAAGTVRAYRLLAVRARAEGRARQLDAPMVGRNAELALLLDAWRRAVDERSPHLVTLVAAAGVGKSRLVHELIARVRAEGGRTLVGRCLSYGEGITYWPIRELVHAAAGISEADDREVAVSKVATCFAGQPDGTRLADRIATVVGLSVDPAPQEELSWAVRRLLEHLAEEQPTLVVLEDLHWAEDTLLDLVDYVIELAAGAPLLVLATARPELVERRPAFVAPRQRATVIRLEPLGADAAGELLAALPGGDAVPRGLRTRILDAAEGNPLYVEEFIGLLRDDGLLVADGEGWLAAGDLEAVTVPVSIQSLLAARLEALPEPERAVAQRASVIGRTFEVAALAELDRDQATGPLARNLLALVRKELLRPDRPELTAGDAFRFRHVLIRDAAYEALPKAERAVLHERVAVWLEQAAGDRLTELEEIAGHHLRMAHDYRVELGETGDRVGRLAGQAATRLVAAGARAGRNGDWHAAVELLESAVTLATLERVGLLHVAMLANALIDIGELDRAGAWLDAAREEAARRGSAAEAARLRLVEGRWGAFTMHEDLEPGPAELGSIMETLEAAGDHEGLAQVWASFSGIHWADMHAEAAAAATARSADELRLAGNQAAEDKRRAWQLALTAMGPAPASEIERLCSAALDHSGTGIALRATALQFLATVRAGQGQFDLARTMLIESLRLYDELKLPFDRALAGFAAVAIEQFAGDDAAAERAARASIQLLQSIGEVAYAEGFAATLAQILEAQDRDDEALALLGPERPGFAYEGTVQRMVSAKISAKRGAGEEAVRTGSAAVAFADTTDVMALRADARLGLAEVLRLAGREPEASAAAAEAAELYRAKGIDVMAKRATRLFPQHGDKASPQRDA